MSFRFDLHAPVSEEARRILLEQTDQALERSDWDNRSKAVHEFRKSCKRARALLGLVRKGLPAGRAKVLARGYRDAAKHIGAARDAVVMRRTFKGLRTDSDKALEGYLPELRDEQEDAIELARADMHRLRAAVIDTNWSGVDRKAVLKGHRRTYSASRKSLAETREDPVSEVIHDWRKVAKAFYFHLQLLVELDAEVLAPMVERADELQEHLGDHHDLGVLLAHLQPQARPGELDDFAARLAERELDLARLAWASAEPLFQSRPKQHTARFASLWSQLLSQ